MSKTKFNINPSQKAQQFMRMSGVPAGLLAPISLDLKANLAPYNKAAKDKPVDLVPVDKQLRWFDRMRSDFEFPYFAVIGSGDAYMQARQLGTIIFWSHLAHALNSGNYRAALPTWVAPTAEFRHTFMEEYKAGEHTAPLLLTVDNVYDDMPNIKLDKVRDLLQIMCDRPRLLIYNGLDPYQFCATKLGVSPNMTLNLGKHQRSHQRRSI